MLNTIWEEVTFKRVGLGERVRLVNVVGQYSAKASDGPNKYKSVKLVMWVKMLWVGMKLTGSVSVCSSGRFTAGMCSKTGPDSKNFKLVVV
ncbi:MAG: hypothetical protein BGN96_06225 [Bacteroidales bacterium 45-6]|nr:MAG: hypothetical protein BGN96_06225 [Bacteroidales bacterium 45-6]